VGLFAALLRPDLGLEFGNPRTVKEISRFLTIIDAWLGKSAFLAGDSVTLADLAAYEEIGQTGGVASKIQLGLGDLSAYRHIERWLGVMAALPGHDKAHAGFDKLRGFVAKKMSKMNKTAAKL